MFMKKYLLLIGALISIALQVSAAKEDVYMTTYQKSHVDKNVTVRRSPMQLPIEVVFDSETRQIEISCNDDLDAQVYLCDENGNILDYSTCLNTVLNVPDNYSGVLIIRIEGEDWIATGEIII